MEGSPARSRNSQDGLLPTVTVRSFAAIDQQLAAVPPGIAALLASIAASSALRADTMVADESSGVAAKALAAAGRGPLSVRTILQAHGTLLGGGGSSIPVDAQAAMGLNELVARYELAVSQQRHPRLLLVSALTLDFATLRPFRECNEEMMRLLVVRELLRDGHDRVCVTAFERRFDEAAAEREGALLASQAGWERFEHAVWPWAEYVLRLLVSAYREVER